MTERRSLVVAGLVLLLIVGLGADRLVGRTRPVVAASPAPFIAEQAPDGALSSTWFCGATTAVTGGIADGRVVIANPTNAPMTGTVSVIPSAGASKDVALNVPPESRAVLRPGDVVPAPFAAALVQIDGPAGAVEQQIRGPLGESTTPCATHASESWYFAAGNTDRDHQMLLSLFNPFPADAIVDLDFATDTGRFTPADLQGVVVPAKGISVIDVGDHVRRRQAVSVAVAVRVGSVVADRIELSGLSTVGTSPINVSTGVSPAAARTGRPAAPAAGSGATLTLGVPTAGMQWYFPDGVTAPGVDERYELYNPTDHEADARVALALDRGSADPFAVTVAPHDRATLVVSGDSRVPPGVAHAVVVSSTNGVPVVAERVITAGPPSAHLGISDLTGSPVAAAHWLFPAGAANDAQDEWLIAFNPGQTGTKLSVTAILTGETLPVDGLQSVDIAPGSRVAVRLGDHLTRGDLVLSVDAGAPVVVERDLYHVGGIGLSAALGAPAP